MSFLPSLTFIHDMVHCMVSQISFLFPSVPFISLRRYIFVFSLTHNRKNSFVQGAKRSCNCPGALSYSVA